MSENKSIIRIGNASGYWGDDPDALERQLKGSLDLDYISMDFLAEITMSIMQKQRQRDPEGGYARDFLGMLDRVLPILKEKKTCIITNAGGVNPSACVSAIDAIAKRQGTQLKVAVVYGDDILENTQSLESPQCKFGNMETGEDFSVVREKLASANIYFGAAGVVKALKHNPDIIITGRVTDTGITLAPMIHEFNWKWGDFDKLASGIVAGHLLECGSQATGGNFTDWKKVPSFHEIGFPIVEVSSDGSFVLTKQPGTGGLVSEDTSREQLFYEMGDPKNYITPDVVADFSSIQLKDLGEDRVKVSGVTGTAPTPFYKVSMAYEDGFKATGSILIAGESAKEKATAFGKIFWDRIGTEGFLETKTELFGVNACHQSLSLTEQPGEILLKLSARTSDKNDLKKFGKMIPALILSGPPGVAVTGGVPKPMQVVSYWPALMPKDLVYPLVTVYQGTEKIVTDEKVELPEVEISSEPVSSTDGIQKADAPTRAVHEEKELFKSSKIVQTIALGRSGDKGDTCNIGIMARSPKDFETLKEHLTAQRVKNLFQEICHGTVTRFELPNMTGLNFLLEQSLGGGGTKSLQSDPQGKTYAQGLLSTQIPEN